MDTERRVSIKQLSLGKKNIPSAPSGTQTRDLSIRNPALYHWTIPALRHYNLTFLTSWKCTDTLALFDPAPKRDPRFPEKNKQTSKQNQHQEQNTPKAISKTNNNKNHTKNNNKKAKTELQYCMAAMSVTWAVNIVSLRFERQAAISQSAVTDKTHEWEGQTCR